MRVTLVCLGLSMCLVWMQNGATLGFVLNDQCRCPAIIDASTGYKVITYQKLGSTVNVMNPGRGFYHQEETDTSQFHKLTNNSYVYSKMDGNHINVVLRIYFLTSYIGKDIGGTFTDRVRADMLEAKRNGWSVILRFAYNNRAGARDNDLTVVLEHIHTLKNSNVFRDFEGIITAIQAGFIGAWGEWHNSTHFADINSCSVDLSSTTWSSRKDVLDALLNAVPKSIEICVRRPLFKYGIWDQTPTTLEEDESMNDKSRIAYHNDAFLNGNDDEGTFRCPNEREYMEKDSLYNVVIGETNSADQPIEMYGCRKAKERLAELHFSMLNGGYKEEVTNSWKNDGCYPEIAAHLGYRLFLKQAILPPVVKRGEELCYKIDIGNDGYAAPHKDFEAHLMLKNSNNGHRYSAVIPMDTRRMQPGATYSQQGSVTVPTTLPNGDYQVLLVILHKAVEKDNTYNMKYNVLLANDDSVQDTVRRENSLKHTITITPGQCSLTTEPLLREWPASIGSSPVSGCPYSLKDGSFEGTSAWNQYQGGYTVHGYAPQDGSHYIRVANGGAEQDIHFDGAPVTEFTLSGYSRAHSSPAVSDPDDYSIYCDLVYTDGSNGYGKVARFSTSTSWHKVSLHVKETKPIKQANCYAMFRNGNGDVDFDNFKLESCA